jgi:hypothetical protein
MSRFLHLRLVRQINPYKTRSLIYYLIVFTKFLYIVEPTVRKRYTGITLTYHYNYTGQKLLVDCMYLLSADCIIFSITRTLYVCHYSLLIIYSLSPFKFKSITKENKAFKLYSKR